MADWGFFLSAVLPPFSLGIKCGPSSNLVVVVNIQIAGRSWPISPRSNSLVLCPTSASSWHSCFLTLKTCTKTHTHKKVWPHCRGRKSRTRRKSVRHRHYLHMSVKGWIKRRREDSFKRKSYLIQKLEDLREDLMPPSSEKIKDPNFRTRSSLARTQVLMGLVCIFVAFVDFMDGSVLKLQRMAISGACFMIHGGGLLMLQVTRRVAIPLALFLLTVDSATFYLCLLEGGGIRAESFLWFLGLPGKANFKLNLLCITLGLLLRLN